MEMTPITSWEEVHGQNGSSFWLMYWSADNVLSPDPYTLNDLTLRCMVRVSTDPPLTSGRMRMSPNATSWGGWEDVGLNHDNHAVGLAQKMEFNLDTAGKGQTSREMSVNPNRNFTSSIMQAGVLTGWYDLEYISGPAGAAGEFVVDSSLACSSTLKARRMIGGGIRTLKPVTHTKFWRYKLTNPVTLDIRTPATVDFGRVIGGGGEMLRDLPIEFTTNGDTPVQFSLQAPPFNDGSKYAGALGSYLYTVYADSSWVGGPTGTLSILGDWNSLPVKMGTSSYKLKVGLKPTGKPFVAGSHSTNLTVTARIL